MEEKTLKNARIKVPIYGYNIELYYGDPDSFIERIKAEYKCEFDNFDGFCQGYAAQLEKHNGKYTDLKLIFYIKSQIIPGTSKQIFIIHHEAIHTAWYILERSGIKINEGNHEALTYLVEFIAESVYSKIEGWTKEK